MRVLLSDGCGLTSRQVARLLRADGHQVGALSPTRLCLCAGTRSVGQVHLVPPASEGPDRWLTAALDVARTGGYDVLLPTQEQVAVLSRHPDRLDAEGVRTVVPAFEALAAVFDKVGSARTLERLGVPQPWSSVVHHCDEVDHFPVFAKVPVATASNGVGLVSSRAELEALVGRWRSDGRLSDGPFLVQEPATGPLAMVQVVLDDGRVVAAHANERSREGVNGGASHKTSLAGPAVEDAIDAIGRLGRGLGWRGALSADVVLSPDGPLVIDVNPRLVEPGNAAAAGVDLVGPLLELAVGIAPEAQPRGRPGVRTHQSLLAVAGAAHRPATRRAVAREAALALTHRGAYASSVEELTPFRGDPRGTWPTALATAACLVAPAAHRWFVSGATSAYALGPDAWSTLLDDPSQVRFDRR